MGLPVYSSSTSTKDTTQPPAQSTPTAAATGAGANTGAGVTRPKTEAEKEADRVYEERMEEEYAKRDGGRHQGHDPEEIYHGYGFKAKGYLILFSVIYLLAPIPSSSLGFLQGAS
ncbi:hypothetical protein AK830_g10634 [Neonectria ditissima]|uniref:Uncharacterized protein n=1 Tax=Neonectria ditissima TaxID=78410 RepID=A0A0P7BA07_9HYPO|nr:hypothetical protein AK830_g10634 [Neonectria ditissima]